LLAISCETESLFVNVTCVPRATVSVFGLTPLPVMVIVVPVEDPPPPPPPLIVVVVVAGGEGAASLPPHAEPSAIVPAARHAAASRFPVND
jgi:hypothetical protein